MDWNATPTTTTSSTSRPTPIVSAGTLSRTTNATTPATPSPAAVLQVLTTISSASTADGIPTVTTELIEPRELANVKFNISSEDIVATNNTFTTNLIEEEKDGAIARNEFYKEPLEIETNLRGGGLFTREGDVDAVDDVQSAGDDIAVPSLKPNGNYGSLCNKCLSDISHGIVGARFCFCCNGFACATCMQSSILEAKFHGTDDVCCPLCNEKKTVSDSKELGYRQDPSSWELDELMPTNEHAHFVRAKLWFESNDLHDEGVKALTDLAHEHQNVEAMVLLASYDPNEFIRLINHPLIHNSNFFEPRKFLLQAKKSLVELGLWDKSKSREKMEAVSKERDLEAPDKVIKIMTEKRYAQECNKMRTTKNQKYEEAEHLLIYGARNGNVECFEKLKQLQTDPCKIKLHGVFESNKMFHNTFETYKK